MYFWLCSLCSVQRTNHLSEQVRARYFHLFHPVFYHLNKVRLRTDTSCKIECHILTFFIIQCHLFVSGPFIDPVQIVLWFIVFTFQKIAMNTNIWCYVILKMYEDIPLMIKLMTSRINKSSINLYFLSSSRKSTLWLVWDKYSSSPRAPPCARPPGRYLGLLYLPFYFTAICWLVK